MVTSRQKKNKMAVMKAPLTTKALMMEEMKEEEEVEEWVEGRKKMDGRKEVMKEWKGKVTVGRMRKTTLSSTITGEEAGGRAVARKDFVECCHLSGLQCTCAETAP